MNISEKNVYQVLFASGEEGMTLKEILSGLNQRMKKKAQLRKALRKLTGKNICYKRDNHYFLKDRSNGVPAGIKFKEKKKRSAGKNRKEQRIPEGVYLKKRGQALVRSLLDGQTYPVSSKEDDWLLHGDRIRFSLKKGRGEKMMALPAEILKHKITLLKGRLKKGTKGEHFFEPLHTSFPRRFKVTNRHQFGALETADVLLKISDYGDGNRIPEGRIDGSMYGTSAQASIIEGILAENRIPLRFPKPVLTEGSCFPRAVRLHKSEKRIDLRSLPFITIDGDDAKDFDDAIYTEIEGKNFRIWVSIADVADYVERNSELDREARKRGTSTYLPEKAVPMLPPVLSNGLCSLKAGVNRKTMTCEILIDSRGKVLATDIYQSLNCIAKRLTYQQVDHFLDTGSFGKNSALNRQKALLVQSRKVADILEKKRRKRGAIDFRMPESSFSYDTENHITGIAKIYQTKAMGLIEQFMLEANEAVARFCEQNKIPILWRNHPPPLPAKISHLKQLFWNNNLKIPELRESGDFNRALRKSRLNENHQALEISVLRTMSLADYGIQREGHFGLAATHYCHFTSPIRRYPDLIVHRGLKAFLNRHRIPAVSERLAVDLSNRERLAANAERAAAKFKKMIFLVDRIGDVMKVKISGFNWKGLFVELSDPYVEGFVDYASIIDDTYDYDEHHHQVSGRKNNRVVTHGSALDVMLTGIDKRQFMPIFDWLGWKDETGRSERF